MIKTFISRPVFTTMFILVLVVFGFISYPRLGMDLYPEVEYPYVNVNVRYTGASPEEMEAQITRPVEDAVSAVSGIKTISSTVREGSSQTIIEFELGTDPRQAASEVREKVAGVRRRLPDNIDEPVVQRSDPSSQPILIYTFSSEVRNRGEVRKIVEDVVKNDLQMLDGVAEVTVVGASERQLQIFVDPKKMESYGISMQEVLAIVNTENANTPGGKIETNGNELTVRTIGKYRNIEDLRAVVISNQGGRLIRLSDVASVVDGWEEERTYSRTNGVPSVGLIIRKQSGTNTVAVSEEVITAMDQIVAQDLPPDFQISLVRDQSAYIIENVHDVWNAIVFGGILAILITYLFLRDAKATVIGSLAIPTSIVATFVLMKWQGFTLNNMSLMGLSLAVGILIDDAIIIIENIYRHMKMGKNKFKAALDGTVEISLAILATTFSLLAVFVPIGNMGEIVGQFFKQFGLTVAFSIAFSLVVAFTLTPMLSAHWLEDEENMQNKYRPLWVQKALDKFENLFEKTRDGYGDLLRWALKYPKKIFFVAVLSLGFNLLLYPFIGKEYQPTYDSGEFSISMKAPAGTSIDKMKDFSQEIEGILMNTAEVQTVNLNIGGSSRPVYEGTINVKLKSTSERDRTMMEIMDDMRIRMRHITGMKVSVLSNQGGGRGDRRPVQVALRGSDLEELSKYANQVAELLRNTPGATDVDISSSEFEPEVSIRLDPNKAAAVGINSTTLGKFIETAFSGNTTGNRFTIGDQDYEILVRLDERYRMNISDISDIPIPINGGSSFVRLGDIAEVKFSSGPTQIDREDRQRQVIVYSNAIGVSQGELLDKVRNVIIPEVNMPMGYRYAFIGQGNMMADAFSEISKALAIAIIMIYMVLAAQFESFTQPLIIMLALPFSLIGAILGLMMSAQTINIMSLMGIILLMGIVTKNAILIVDYTNQARHSGKSLQDSIIEAGQLRLRPILMTTFAAVFAMLPIALGIGAGAELRQSMGVAIVGGLLTSTLLSLVVVPIGYLMLEGYQEKRKTRKKT